MAGDEYYEALLARIQHLRDEIAPLSAVEATEFAYRVSREMPEEAARMLVAEILLEYWQQRKR